VNDRPDPPRVFANRVIRQMIDHMLAEDMIAEPKDYLTMRTAFRAKGGSWSAIGEGSTKDLETLKDIVIEWGQMPDREKESDREI